MCSHKSKITKQHSSLIVSHHLSSSPVHLLISHQSTSPPSWHTIWWQTTGGKWLLNSFLTKRRKLGRRKESTCIARRTFIGLSVLRGGSFHSIAYHMYLSFPQIHHHGVSYTFLTITNWLLLQDWVITCLSTWWINFPGTWELYSFQWTCDKKSEQGVMPENQRNWLLGPCIGMDSYKGVASCIADEFWSVDDQYVQVSLIWMPYCCTDIKGLWECNGGSSVSKENRGVQGCNYTTISNTW